MGRLLVREARIEDARGIAEVRVDGWQAAYRGLIPDAYLDGMCVDTNEERTKRWLANPLDSVSFVCAEDEKIVGWTTVHFPGRDKDLDRSVAELSACYARRSVWGRGVGFQLWNAARHTLQNLGAREMSLWVLRGNSVGIQFYERQGLTFDGATKTETLMPGIELTELRMRCVL